MLRVSKNLLLASVLIGAATAGCGSEEKVDPEAGLPPPIAGLIQFSPMYSAFDGGEHTYQITPYLPAADPKNKDSDPIVGEPVWTVDETFVKRDPFSEIPGAILLTTKKAGSTIIKVTATRMSGAKVRGQSMLTISTADPAEWLKGDMRYSNGMMINLFGGMGGVMGAPMGMGDCGLPVTLTGRIPTNSACTNCHNNTNGLVVEHTPTQTAGYDNEELIEIFTNAQKPAGGMFNSPILRMAPMPDCIYRTFHTWQIDEDTKQGIVWKLRSIPPKRQEELDIARIAMMAAARRAMGGAAGAPAQP